MSRTGRPRRKVSLRLRMTLLLLSIIALVLLVLAVLVYAGLRRTMMALVDLSLERAVTKALTEDLEYGKGLPTFIDTEDEQEPTPPPSSTHSPYQVGPAVRVRSADGSISSGTGPYESLPVWPVRAGGFSTEASGSKQWRVYSQPLGGLAGEPQAWLQAAESLEFVHETLLRMLRFFLVGFPALLLIFGFAGSWLTARSLKPIVDITKTASAINENDLSSRIRYRGSTSEISSLAASFDRMLDRLEAAFNRERRFTSDAAHELRTPLTAIRGQLEVALRRTRTPKEYSKTLRNLQQYVIRLIRLAGDLLFMSSLERIPAGQNQVLISLGELLEAIADQVAPALRAKRLSLMLHKKEAAIVRGDMDRLIRLFLNLVDNATKYAPEDGTIKVDIERNHSEVRVSISNTGPGIPKEEIPFIFDRFYRVKTDRSRQSGGAGLGLSIAQEIARQHGGTITAQSKPNLFTTFTVLLPCLSGSSDDQVSAGATTGPEAADPASRKYT